MVLGSRASSRTLPIDEVDDIIDKLAQLSGASLEDAQPLPFDQNEILEDLVIQHSTQGSLR